MNVRLLLIWLLLTMFARVLAWTVQPPPEPDRKNQVLAYSVRIER